MKRAGASLSGLAEQFDTSAPIGQAMIGFAAIWVELKADTARERVPTG